MKKKLTFVCVFLLLSNFVLSASPSSVQAANRRTAVRCLKLAKNYLSSNEIENALAQVELALSYDSTISDLWYIKAAALNLKGEARANIIPLVMKAMTEGEWVDYNRDGARILYADMLCDTGSYDQALAILDTTPFIYNADAEFIRAKAYYRIGTEDSVDKAREKINSARKIYSLDMRFPRLFFKYEYYYSKKMGLSGLYTDSLVQKIADSFIAKMPEYDNPDAELEIYAAIFAEPSRQKRLLQAFSAHGMKHPLYAVAALENGLMTQQEAWDYFTSFADKSISLDMLEDFIPHITDEVTVESAREHLNAYSGLLLVDTNGDLESELYINYLRGRPASFRWDANNDGIIEWEAKCDFGVPEYISITQGNLLVTYGTYPSIVRAVYKSDIYEKGAAVFNLLDETMNWTPVDIKTHELIKFLFDVDFYIPFPRDNDYGINTSVLLASCSSYEIPATEKPGAFIRFSVLDGKPQTADYFYNGEVYAHCTFDNGLPYLRAVDNNGDGIFETTEFFGFDSDGSFRTSETDQNQVMANIFGLPSYGTGLYVRMIQIDQDGDTVPDFTEEYLSDEGKITSWDNNGDGKWDVRYKKYPRTDKTLPLVEDYEFYSLTTDQIVTITLWDGESVKVSSAGRDYKVTQGISDGFYWVGEEGNADDEYYILTHFDSSLEQGVSVLLEGKNSRMLAVKVAGILYAQILPDLTDEEKFQGDEAGKF